MKNRKENGAGTRGNVFISPSFVRASPGSTAQLRARLTKAPATHGMPQVKSGHTVCHLSKCKTFVL